MFDRLDSGSDLLSETILGAQLGGVLTSRAIVHGAFGLRFGRMRRRAGFHIVLAGRATAIPEGGTAVEVAEGDVILFPHGTAHRLADSPRTPAIDVDLQAREIPASAPIDGPRVEFMCGAYDLGTTDIPLMHGLPEVVLVRASEARDTSLPSLIALLRCEAAAPASGRALALRRLVDLLFIHTIRTWTEAHGQGSWLGAAADPAIGAALAAIHGDPARAWTVGGLASVAGMSRAAFARHFREATGVPPLAYVTDRRMAHAAERLAAGRRVYEVAAEVGYHSEFAFAKAFKRVRGVPPGSVRRREAAAPPA